jgi:TrwC relaxase
MSGPLRACLSCKCHCLSQIGWTARDRRLSGWCARFVSASGGCSLVLTIGKLGASRAQLRYYEQQVAAGLEDYYAGRGEARRVWRGAGAEALGLGGRQVGRDGFMALMRGRSPVDGGLLRMMGGSSTVAAIDLTFSAPKGVSVLFVSAPKGVSVLFAVADDQVSAALLAAHERAVEQALGYLKREACWTCRGRGGAEPSAWRWVHRHGVSPSHVAGRGSAVAHACRDRESDARSGSVHGAGRPRAI